MASETLPTKSPFRGKKRLGNNTPLKHAKQRAVPWQWDCGSQYFTQPVQSVEVVAGSEDTTYPADVYIVHY